MYKSLQITEPNHSAVIESEDKEIKADFVRVKVNACGICGTDIHIFRGDYMGGYPVIPGHEFSGLVDAIGYDVDKFSVGDRVAVEPNLSCGICGYCKSNKPNFCENWQAVGVTIPGGMSEYVDVPQSTVFNIGELSFEEAIFMEPLSCCVHGIENVKINSGDNVAVFGAGPIGLLLIQLVSSYGANHITVLDKNSKRLEFAQKLCDCIVLDNIKSIEEEKYDVVIDATGAISLMEFSLDCVKKGGRILLFGVPPKESKLNLSAFKIFEKGLTLLSSFTSVRNSLQALQLIQSGEVKVKELISHKLGLSEFEKGVRLIEDGYEEVRKVILLP